MSEYKKTTDQVHTITLPSKITRALWSSDSACVEEKVNLEVWTQFVGDGSEISIIVKDKSGNTLEEIDGLVKDNFFSSSVVVSKEAEAELSFTASLPKHNLKMDSDNLELVPPRRIISLRWGQEVARRGDIVKMMSDTEGIPDEMEVTISIYEHDQDGNHDFITKFPATVRENRIEAEWEYEYHEDTDEIPTQEEKEKYGENYNPPEYFFVIDVYRQRFGENQESELLVFRDWIEVLLTNGREEPIPDESYILYLPDGNTKEGNTNSEGTLKEEKIPPGKVFIEFPGLFNTTLMGDEAQGKGRESPPLPTYISMSSTEKPERVVTVISNDLSEDDGEPEDEQDFDEIEFVPFDDSDLPADDNVQMGEEELYDEPKLEYRNRYDIASARKGSGKSYHFALLDCISIHLYQAEGEKPKLPMEYQIKDDKGATVFDGITESGVIFHDYVMMADYELVIDGLSYHISSSPHASDIERVYLSETKS